MKPLHKYFIFSIVIFFTFCTQKADENLENKLEKEFEQRGLEISDNAQNIQFAPDWKARVFFKNDKALAIFIKTIPETGFTTKRIYFDGYSGLEKIVYRKCLPDFNEENGKLYDSTFIIFPKKNIVETYCENKFVKSTTNIKVTNTQIKESLYYKHILDNIK